MSHSHAPAQQFRRWSSQELQQNRKYLEAKKDEEFSRDDYWLLVEWLLQRYLPDAHAPSPEQWQAAVARLQDRVDAALRQPFGPATWQSHRSPSRYAITKPDIYTLIVPALQRFSFCPKAESLDWCNRPVEKALELMASKVWVTKAEGRDRLSGLCDVDLVCSAIDDLVRVYEETMTAYTGGIRRLKVLSGNKQCQRCRALDSKTIDIESMLAGFIAGIPQFPHETLAGEYCPAPGLLPISELSDGDDPEFRHWLTMLFEADLAQPSVPPDGPASAASPLRPGRG